MWDVKEPTHYSKRAGHEVPSVAAVLCECMGGTEKVICLARDLVTRLHITLHFGAKVAKTKTKTCSRQLLNLVLVGLISWSMISLSYTAVVIHPLQKCYINNLRYLGLCKLKVH